MKKTNKKFSFKELANKLLNNIKKFWYIYSLALLLIVSSIIVVSIINSKKENNVKQYIENKTFVIKYDDEYKAYSFKNGFIAKEEGYRLEYSDKDDSVSGDINDYSNKYKVKASIFTDEIWVLTKYPHGYIRTIAVCIENDIVNTYKHTSTTPDWKEATLDEVEYIRVDTLCKHELKTDKILKESSCTQVGQEKTICSKCKHIFTNEIPKKAHTYQNGACTICKALAKIQPNKWYTHDDGIKYLNCEIDFVTKVSMLKDRCIVKFYGVCEHCSEKSTKASSLVLYYGSYNRESFRCQYCNKFTYANLKHEY